MASYSIRDLERLSGQKAHTIRMWEQRYQLLSPQRSDSNIRIYGDTELKKLLNVCTLLAGGNRISTIAALSDEEVHEKVELIIAGLADRDAQTEGIISQAMFAIATYDEAVFNELFSASVALIGFQETYIRVVYPLLLRTGVMWVNNMLQPAQEHFLSNLIKQKLFSAINALPPGPATQQTWVLFLHEEEDHEIGLLFAHYLLRLLGRRVIYLGAKVPYDNLAHVVAHSNCAFVYTFFVNRQPPEKFQQIVSDLRTDFPQINICVSGSPEILNTIKVDHEVQLISEVIGLLEMIART